MPEEKTKLKEHCDNCILLRMLCHDFVPPTGYCGHSLRIRYESMTDFENTECLFWNGGDE